MMTWWEFLIPIAVSLILITGFKFGVETSQTRDVEYWGSYITETRYYERWNEYIHKTCHREDCIGTGENRTCVTVSYDCSYVDNHPPYWTVLTNTNMSLRVGRSKYESLVDKFGNEQFKDMNRNYHTIDGDMYYSLWSDSLEIEDVVTSHYYENRVQASNDVYSFDDVSEQDVLDYELYTYPKIKNNHFEYPTVLGYSDDRIQKSFRDINAVLGKEKQVRIWVLIYRNQPLRASILQENLWKGGNKNEFVITIGIDNQDHVKWARVFSWSEVEIIKVKTREFITDQDILDLELLASWIKPQLETHFIRKEFADFSYLSVKPPMWAIVLTFVVTLLTNIGIGYYVVNNEFRAVSSRNTKLFGSFYY